MINRRHSSQSSYLAVMVAAFMISLFLVASPQRIVGQTQDVAPGKETSPGSSHDPLNDEEHTLYLPLMTNAYCAPFVDDFSNEGSGWPVGENNDLIFGYRSGEYQIRSKRAGDFYLFPSPACQRDNHTVEVDVRWEGEPGQVAGLIFDLKDNFEQFYLFGINSEDQTYALEYFGPEGWILLIQARKSDAIHPDQESNHLQVTRLGDNIVLEINGTTVDEITDDRSVGLGSTGLYTFPFRNRPQSDARFDNFVSRYAAQSQIPNS